MKKLFLIFALILNFQILLSTNTIIDSLEAKINKVSSIEKIQILNILSKEYREISPRKSIDFGNQALELAENIENRKEKANSLNNIAVGYYFLSNYEQALQYYQQALKINQDIDNKSGIATLYNNIGLIYQKLSSYDKALNNFLNSLEIERELDNQEGISMSLNNLGNVFYNVGNYNKALEFYQESLKIEEKIGNKKSIAMALNNIGIVHSDHGDYNEALEYYQRSLDIEKELGNINSIATSLNNIGLVYKNKNDYNKALEYLLRSLNLTLEIGDKYGIANTFVNIGELYSHLGNDSKALANLMQGLKLAQEIDAKSIIIEAYLSFSEYHSKNKNFVKSLEYYKLYSEEKDKIFNADISTQLATLQTKFEFSEREKKIKLLQKNNKIYKLEADKRKLYNLVLLIGIVSVIILAGIIYHRSRAKSKFNQQLKDEVIERMSTEKELKYRLELEEALVKSSSRFIKVSDFDTAINDTLADIGRACDASRSYLFLLKNNDTLMDNTHEWCAKGVNPQIDNLKDLSTETFPWWMKKLNNGEVIHEKNVSLMPEEAHAEKKILQEQDIKSILVLPLRTAENLKGFIGLDNIKETQKWKNEDISLLKLSAEIIGLYIERNEMEDKLQYAYNNLEVRVKDRTRELAETNQELQLEIAERKRAEQELNDSYYKLKKAMEETVNAFISAVEIRDPYTAGHQLRVANLSRAIANEMNLSKEQLDSIRIAAILHDIGKIYIPNEILGKPTKLTEMEFSVVKNHPLAGYDILKVIDFQMPVAKIVYQHHERLDGSGYPQGLVGKEIMLEARIINVADVVDAMISQRPYRPSQGINEALDEIFKNSGISYDPDVVQHCINLFNEKGFQFEEIKIRTTTR